MNMGRITFKNDISEMEIDFEATVIHLYNCLTEAKPGYIILSVDSKTEEGVGNQGRRVDYLHKKCSGGGDSSRSVSVSKCKNRAKRYWEI